MATLLDALPLVGTLRDAVFLSAKITEIDQVTTRLRRVRFAGPRLQGLTWTPGQHIRLQVAGLVRLQDALRTYSIHDADAAAGTLDIVMLTHDGDPDIATPARKWMSDSTIGDSVSMTRPQGRFVIRDDAPYHLFIGEETASVAFAAMLRSLPDSAEVRGVIEGARTTDHLPLDRDLTHVERGDASAADSAVLTDALRALQLPDQPGVAYLAGEARTVQSARRHLISERGWDRRSICTKPFWTPGRRGMD